MWEISKCAWELLSTLQNISSEPSSFLSNAIAPTFFLSKNSVWNHSPFIPNLHRILWWVPPSSPDKLSPACFYLFFPSLDYFRRILQMLSKHFEVLLPSPRNKYMNQQAWGLCIGNLIFCYMNMVPAQGPSRLWGYVLYGSLQKLNVRTMGDSNRM